MVCRRSKVEQDPLAVAVGPALEQHLEGAVPGRPDGPAAAVAEPGLHLGDPLAVGGPAQAEAVGEQAGPVLAGAGVAALAGALAPEVLGPLLAVPVVRVPPQPRGEGPVLVGRAVAAGDPLVELRLRLEEPLERGAGQLAGVPRVLGPELRVADVGGRRGGEEQGEEQGEKA